MGEDELDIFSILIGGVFVIDYYLQNTNFLSLSDKESVIMSLVNSSILWAEDRN